MKVCIYGAGAIGGYIGIGLRRSGIDVALVARGAHLAAMRESGLRLLIDGREYVERMRCTDAPATLGIQDYVIIALKAHSIPGAVPAMLPLLGAHTTIVTASNGLPYWFFDVPGVPFQGLALSTVDPDGRQRALLGTQRAVGCEIGRAHV